jgi:hypothetical protein
VTPEVLAVQLSEELRARFSSQAYYCAAPGCGVAYFDAWGAAAPREALAVVPYPKNPTGPVCSCLGVTAAELAEDARRGDRERVRRILAHVRGAQASCALKSPDGNSCERTVRQVFLEHLPSSAES